MGHGKLRKFAENETFACLKQPSASEVLDKESGSRELRLKDHALKGRWGVDVFGNSNPIVLELGCGGGEYTVALAERNPAVNYIGVDIKGARLWKGAKYATQNNLSNVAFLRTRIEFIEAFFGPSEVSEIWLTFSDPQLSGSPNARLTSPMFLERYRKFLMPGGVVHLKTDSRFLHEYTMAVASANNLNIIISNTDIYGTHGGYYPENPSDLRSSSLPLRGPLPLMKPRAATGFQDNTLPAPDMEMVTGIQTFYEKMFLEMGLPTTYMAFTIDHEGPYVAPADFDAAYWKEQEGPRRTFNH